MTAICIGLFISYGMAGLADLKWGYLLIQRYNWKQVSTTPHGNIYLFFSQENFPTGRIGRQLLNFILPSLPPPLKKKIEAITALMPSPIIRKYEKGRIHQHSLNAFHIVLHYEPWSDLHQYECGYSCDFHYLFPILQIN